MKMHGTTIKNAWHNNKKINAWYNKKLSFLNNVFQAKKNGITDTLILQW
jgi:hypothetical protein